MKQREMQSYRDQTLCLVRDLAGTWTAFYQTFEGPVLAKGKNRGTVLTSAMRATDLRLQKQADKAAGIKPAQKESVDLETRVILGFFEEKR
jgi:hypothetical protein